MVLTGDFHWSDVKAVRPGAGPAYAAAYGSDRWAADSHPIFQVMASGLTTGTNGYKPCDRDDPPYYKQHKWTRDPTKLRGPKYGPCDFVRNEASFGMVEVDWEAGVAALQVRSGEKGSGGKVLYEYKISLDTCQEVQ